VLKSKVMGVVCLFLVMGVLSSCFRSAPPQPVREEITPQSILSTKPANGGELALGSEISVTFNEAMNAASVERSVSIFPGVYDPSKNPASFTSLQLTSMCNGKWRVRNPNATAISFTWDIYNTTTKGLGVVPASSDAFFYTPTGSNTVRVFVGTKQQQVKATNPAACTGQAFTFSWSADAKTVKFKPTDALADGKAYTVVISTAVRNANNQANQTSAYGFGVRVEDYNKYIDPGIQGAERDVMLKALVDIRPQDRENVIFRDAAGNYYTNKEFLKAT
jgi:Bacterial Ig-like domain